MLVCLFFGGSIQAQDSLHVHVISGSKEYNSEASLQSYKKHLQRTYDVKITGSWVQDGAQDLPGIEQVPKADVLLVFTRRMKLPFDQMAVLRWHWQEGKPIVGIRTASHAFRRSTNQIFDHKVLGGNYQGHFGDAPVEVQNVAELHPVLNGVKPFKSRKMYKAGKLAEDATVLQTGTTKINGNSRTHPVTWTHCYHGGRTVYTSLGVPEDFETQSFRRLLTNALFWVAGRQRPEVGDSP